MDAIRALRWERGYRYLQLKGPSESREAEVLLNESLDMPKISVEVPEELLTDLDDHVGEDGKFVNRSEAIRASIRKTLDLLDEIDQRHGRIDDEH
jgi:hypothetical protein